METPLASPCLMADAAPVAMIPQRTADSGKPTFQELFAAEESPLLRYAYGFTGQREVAEDLVQEAFLKLHTHWAAVVQPRAWLYRSVRNLALNHRRDHQRESPLDPGTDPAAATADPGEALGRQEVLGSLQLLVSELQEDERALVTLKYHEGLKYEQISQLTGLSIGNVGYKLHHVLKHLAESLKRLGIESAEN